MAKQTTKEILLDVGKQLFLERGYGNTGIEAIVQAAGVPKGSFYHYFESKEAFGVAVLNRFAECVNADLDQTLTDPTYSPVERLKRLVESRCERLESQQCRNGCLIGNLSLEMADQSEVFRTRLGEIFRGWAVRYADCLQKAQELGEIPDHLDINEYAEFWLNSWQGAVLRAKTIRSTAPLRTFQAVMFRFVLETSDLS
jgi:TetR/AcrR family transcriptional regulator, transcriptional repressor for nem operon